MRQLIRWRTVTTVVTVAAIVYAIRTGRPEGTFVKVPYDFRFPTVGRLRERFWNPEDSRIFTPHYFGVGWSLNVYQLLQWLRAYRDEDESAVPPAATQG